MIDLSLHLFSHPEKLVCFVPTSIIRKESAVNLLWNPPDLQTSRPGVKRPRTLRPGKKINTDSVIIIQIKLVLHSVSYKVLRKQNYMKSYKPDFSQKTHVFTPNTDQR